MDNIKNIVLLLTIMLASSCSLDKDPISSFSADGFYQSSDDAQAGVYGIYDAVQSTFRWNFAYWGEGRADAVDTRHSGDPLMLKQNSLTRTMSSANWNNLYEVISRANYAIKYIPDAFEEESDFSRQLVGQSKALRALAYFYAVRIWGDIPLLTEPFESIDQDIYSTRSPKEEVLAQIEEDLLYASENCKRTYGGDNDRILITQGAVYALLTKLYMWQKEYDKAIETADQVLSNNLYSLVSIGDWSKIFTSGYSNESIFEVGYDETQTNQLRVLYALGSDSDYFPSESFRNSFEENDPRQKLIYDVAEDEPRKIWKFFGEGFNDESADPSSNNIVLLRLADIILLKAEALNEIGQEGEALESLNVIRRRANLPEMDASSASEMYGDIAHAISHERLIELSFEGHRWFDLLRTGRAIEVMGPINGLNDEKNLVWPISEDALNRNPNLDQNEFYK